MEQESYKTITREAIRQYLTKHYSTTEGLAITIEYDTYGDMLLFIHRPDDTWRIVALNFREKTRLLQACVVPNRWLGWTFIPDKSQPQRTAPLDEDVNVVHRLRDRVAFHYCIVWQHVYAYTLFPTIEAEAENSSPSDDWFNKMQILGVGALRANTSESGELIAPELIKFLESFLFSLS